VPALPEQLEFVLDGGNPDGELVYDALIDKAVELAVLYDGDEARRVLIELIDTLQGTFVGRKCQNLVELGKFLELISERCKSITAKVAGARA
jgi:hypothetical protein